MSESVPFGSASRSVAWGAGRGAAWPALGRFGGAGRDLLPGLLLCGAIALAAFGLGRAEVALLGRPWLEPLVLAILLGAAVRTVWTPPARTLPGVKFTGKRLLEIAVVLLGPSLSAAAIGAAGPVLLGGAAALVAAAIGCGYAIARLTGLTPRMSFLIAAGNAICGNSAIAALAPVVEAEGAEVTTAIGYTAVLGVGVVLLLPLAGAALHLAPGGYGALSGFTVYAVPQVLAAAQPMGTAAVAAGTLTKLLRVLMLGPVCIAACLVVNRGGGRAGARLPAGRLVPWFIVGFLGLATLRSAGVLAPALVAAASAAAGVLTLPAMAALGLEVEFGAIRAAGPKVALAATAALAVLFALGLGLVKLSGL